jgi:hypothetical protein
MVSILLPTIETVCPAFNDVKSLYAVPGPDRQKAFFCKIAIGLDIASVEVGVIVGIKVEVAVGVWIGV